MHSVDDMDPAVVKYVFDMRGERFTDDHQADIRGLVAAFPSVRPELPLSRSAG